MTYETGEGRLSYSNKYVVYVYDGWHHPFYKTISLKWHWWQIKSPAQKIREARDKAEAIARKLNATEAYHQHEIKLAGGDDE